MTIEGSEKEGESRKHGLLKSISELNGEMIIRGGWNHGGEGRIGINEKTRESE